MNIIRDIQPISVLRRKSAQLMAQLRETGEPVVLTHNGEPRLVVQDAEAYQEMVDERERLQTLLAIQEGLEDIKAGRTRPVEEVFKELDRKHAIRR